MTWKHQSCTLPQSVVQQLLWPYQALPLQQASAMNEGSEKHSWWKSKPLIQRSSNCTWNGWRFSECFDFFVAKQRCCFNYIACRVLVFHFGLASALLDPSHSSLHFKGLTKAKISVKADLDPQTFNWSGCRSVAPGTFKSNSQGKQLMYF